MYLVSSGFSFKPTSSSSSPQFNQEWVCRKVVVKHSINYKLIHICFDPFRHDKPPLPVLTGWYYPFLLDPPPPLSLPRDLSCPSVKIKHSHWTNWCVVVEENLFKFITTFNITATFDSKRKSEYSKTEWKMIKHPCDHQKLHQIIGNQNKRPPSLIAPLLRF